MRDNGAIEGAATGFPVGDEVIVLKKYDDSEIKVIGHVGGIRRCTAETMASYYLFYLEDGTLKIANCDSALEVLDTLEQQQLFVDYTPGAVNKITWFCKRFSQVVNGTSQDLYLIATNLFIQSAPYAGWTAFAAANPAHPLVTNTANSQITWTAELMTALNSVNLQVNTEHTYVAEYGLNDNWKILGPAESADCEDFALTKAQALLALGYPASALHIECGLIKGTDRGDGYPKGHAWLVVQTTLADYALDVNSNAVVVNSALTFGTDDFYARRRQIGSKWAFISAYGWLEVSTLTTPGSAQASVSYYILDPVLNIFHRMQAGAFADSAFPGWSGAIPFVGAEQLYENYPHYLSDTRFFSVNFSATKIYLCRSYSPEHETHLDTYSFDGHACTLDSTNIESGKGLVGTDGSFIQIPEDGEIYLPSVNSENGYFDIDLIKLIPGPLKLNLMIGKSGNDFLQYGVSSGHYQMPDGNSVNFSGQDRYANCWTQVDTDSLLLQAVVIEWGATPNYHAYKNGVSFLDEMKAAVGVTGNEDFLGLAYVPMTDRLNRT